MENIPRLGLKINKNNNKIAGLMLTASSSLEGHLRLSVSSGPRTHVPRGKEPSEQCLLPWPPLAGFCQVQDEGTQPSPAAQEGPCHTADTVGRTDC